MLLVSCLVISATNKAPEGSAASPSAAIGRSERKIPTKRAADPIAVANLRRRYRNASPLISRTPTAVAPRRRGGGGGSGRGGRGGGGRGNGSVATSAFEERGERDGASLGTAQKLDTKSADGSHRPSSGRETSGEIESFSGEPEGDGDGGGGDGDVGEIGNIFQNGKAEESRCWSPIASVNLRARYDRELLAILEEEQAAEGMREKALAVAWMRSRVAEARAGDAATSCANKQSHSDMAGPSSSVYATDGGDNVPAMRENGNVSTPRGNEKKNTADVAKSTTEKTAIVEAREEAEVAVREAKQLEADLARERRAASERIMRVSEAYEEALRAISQPKPQ